MDLCHAWCSEHDIAGALARAAPLTRYLHVSDAPAGYNLKIASDAADLVFDLDFASVLVYFPDDAGFRHTRVLEQDFLARTEGMAIRRTGYEGWSRNIAVALGNAPTSAPIVAALQSRAEDASALVREHVAWALAQHALGGALSGKEQLP